MDIKITGNKFVISGDFVDDSKQKKSASGKSKIAFTTSGFVGIPGTDMKISINITKPN